MKISLVQFEYIIALDTYRHFAKAADACFVTQPTLSMQIQKMEDSLDVKIFDRSKQPVVPTEVGKLIIEQAKKSIAEAKRIEEIIQEERGEVKGELVLGVIPTVAPYLFPHFINSFVKKYPAVKLRVREMLTEEILTALNNDIIDIGIAVTPISDKRFKYSPLYYEEFFAYVDKHSPLMKKEKISSRDIEKEQLWLLNEGHCFREQVLNICKGNEDNSNLFQYQSGSLEALKNMVEKQGGLTLLPEMATLNFENAQSKQLIAFEEPVPIREVSLLIKRSFLKKRMVEAMKEEIMENLPTAIKLKDRNRAKIMKWH